MMRRASFGALLIAIAGAIGFGAYWFFVRSEDSGETAEAALTRLSRQSGETTYYARFEGADLKDPNSLSSLTFYNKPSAGFRVDFPAPINLEDDAKQENALLKSGDIFLAPSTQYGRYISCRSQRQSCRTADGLELFAILAFRTLFRFDVPLVEQPHKVTRGDKLSAAGEIGNCFVVSQRTGSNNEQATATKGNGFVPGAGLPKTFCYTNDGVPLGGLVSDTSPNTNWTKAVEIRREVDDSAFDPPFPLVPSIYDPTPTPTP